LLNKKSRAFSDAAIFIYLRFNRGVHRADACARAAVDAIVRLDYVNGIALRDAGNGAFALASAAAYAFVVD